MMRFTKSSKKKIRHKKTAKKNPQIFVSRKASFSHLSYFQRSHSAFMIVITSIVISLFHTGWLATCMWECRFFHVSPAKACHAYFIKLRKSKNGIFLLFFQSQEWWTCWEWCEAKEFVGKMHKDYFPNVDYDDMLSFKFPLVSFMSFWGMQLR